MVEQHNSEKGQALILLVLAFVVLLGFVALAVDGSMVYADRRHQQNAADSGALAGANAAALYLENYYVEYQDFELSGSTCVSSDPIFINKINESLAAAEAAGLARIETNGYYTHTAEINITAACRGVDYGTWQDKYIDVTAVITADTSTAFAHFVYSGPVRNTVTAVARVRPRSPAALGKAIVALREECQGNDGGVTFDGGVIVDVIGGGIFSNACLDSNGQSVYVQADSIACTYYPPDTSCYTNQSGGPVNPTPVEGTQPIPRQSFNIPAPDCSVLQNRTYHNNDTEISPGIYESIRVNAGDSVRMLPGLYCIDDPGQQVGDIVVNGGGRLYTNPGDGVTIYITEGNFTVTGGVGNEANVQLYAPPNDQNDDCPYCPPAIPGLLLYLADGNTGSVDILGDSSSEYIGTVFAPDGTINVGGGSMQEVNAQVIGDTIKVHGNTNWNVTYLNDMYYTPPAYMEVAR